MKMNYKKLIFNLPIKMTRFLNPYSKSVIRGQGFGDLLDYKMKPRDGKVTFSFAADIPKDELVKDIINKSTKKKSKFSTSDESEVSSVVNESKVPGLSNIYNMLSTPIKNKNISDWDFPAIEYNSKKNTDNDNLSTSSSLRYVQGKTKKKKKKQPVDNNIVNDIVGKAKSGMGFYNV